MDVGLIGIGNMGAGMAKSLLRGGHKVKAYNRTKARAEALRADGATVAETVEEACQADAVITMLADDPALEAAVFGKGGVLESLAKGKVHISSSTISVALSARMADAHAKAGQGYVAAPVFGRPDAAAAGRLAVAAGGPKELIERCTPIFQALGPKLYVVSEKPELANTVKVAGNFLIGTVVESLSEAYTLVKKSGIEVKGFHEFLTSTLFDAPVYKTYGALIAEPNFGKPGFAARLSLKDVKLALEAAGAKDVPLPIASVVRDRLLTAIARGNGDKDWTVLGQIAQEDAGIKS